MENAKAEKAQREQVVEVEAQLRELAELQMALVGGGEVGGATPY